MIKKKKLMILVIITLIITFYFILQSYLESNKYVFCFFSDKKLNTGKGINRSYRDITFKYKKTNAQNVKISGEFNDWQEEGMIKEPDSTWIIKKRLVKNMEYAYQFDVDGVSGKDPENPEIIQRGIKGECSLVKKNIINLYDVKENINDNKKTEMEKFFIYGNVLDADNKSITEAIIKISVAGKEISRTITGEDGKYEIKEIPEGNYDIKAWKKGYKDKTNTTLLKKNSKAEINFILDKLE